MVKVLENQIVKIPKEALRRGVVILDLAEYKKLAERKIPTYRLKEKAAKELDKLVKEGLREYKAGKCKTIKSLADLD